MEPAFGAVVAGPIPAPVMFRLFPGEALTLMVILTAALEMFADVTCSRQLRVALSVLDVPESAAGKSLSACWRQDVAAGAKQRRALDDGIRAAAVRAKRDGRAAGSARRRGQRRPVPHVALVEQNRIPRTNVCALTLAIVCQACRCWCRYWNRFPPPRRSKSWRAPEVRRKTRRQQRDRATDAAPVVA